MAKRKREDAHDTHAPPRKRSAIPKSHQSGNDIEDHIAHGVRDLTRALRQAKGFERQRLGKRLKEAAKAEDDASVQRINAEIATLKSLESRADLAQHHLYKVLLRVKSIREAPELPNFVEAPPKSEDDAKIGNVVSRMFNSKAASAAIAKAVGEVQACLGLEDEKVARSSRDGRTTSRSSSDQVKPVQEGHDRRTNSSSAGSTSPPAHVLDDDTEGSEDEHDSGKLDHRVASPSGGSIANGATSDDQPSDYDSDFDRLTGRALRTMSKPSFLPSLSMGGYLSGSDGSEPEDLEALRSQRKNRRGQRARQQIWEKKFGARAKHLKDAEAKDRNAGWDAKRGAQAAGEKRRPGQPWRREAAPTMASGSNDVKLGKRKSGTRKEKSDDAPLHPSWVAKKAAKERESKDVAFQGKKITFD